MPSPRSFRRDSTSAPEAAVVDVLEQDRAAEEDDVSAEQASSPVVLEQERQVAGRMPRRADALEGEIADRDPVSFGELSVDRARVEAVLDGVDAGELRGADARPRLVSGAHELRDVARDGERRVRQQFAHARCPTGVIAVGMGADELR